MFSSAKQAEIIRSNQKDDYYLNALRGSLTDTVQSFLGPRFWIRWRRELELLADVGYFCLTTLSGYQTLGEEYVGILQVDSTQRSIPSKWRRAGMVGLHVLTPYLLDRLLTFLEKELRNNTQLYLSPDARTRLLELIPTVRHAVILLHRCHLAGFYLHGLFYHIAKRLSDIRYILVRKQTGEAYSSGYRILGWLSLIQLTFVFAQKIYKLYQSRTQHGSQGMSSEIIATRPPSESMQIVTAANKCSLCLDVRQQSTATPCGHLYCWDCITEWCATKPQCPLCRDKVEISRLIFLQNYDVS